MNFIMLLLGLLLFQPPDSTQSLTLAYCHRQIEQQYPTADKIELQKKITAINKKIAQTGDYPDLAFSGMASYQSDVTEVTFAPPGGSVPTFSKDHYKVGLDVSQSIYNGGITGKEQALEEHRGAREIHSVEQQLYQLKEQVNGVYFGILNLQQRARSVDLLMENLRSQLQSVRSKVENGVLLRSQAYVLEAELIKAEQDSIQVEAELAGAKEVLGILIDQELDNRTTLVLPKAWIQQMSDSPIQRPEYSLFESSRSLLDSQMSLAESQKTPNISAFATTAYGRPGLDAFDDDLQAYYIVGVRLQWNFWKAFNAGREQQALKIKQQQIDADQEAFTRQVQSELERIRENIGALEEVISRDQQIIELTRQVVEESSSQLNQGVITSTEYVVELNRLNQAQLSKELHEIKLAEARIAYQTKLGVPLQ